MPDLPIKQKPYTHVDTISNDFAIPVFIDCDKDDFMSNTFRPGLGGDTSNYFVDLSDEKIDGIFDIINYGFAAVVSGGYLYKVEKDGTQTLIVGDRLRIGQMVSFADFGDIGFFCNNSRIVKWTYTTNVCSYIADPDAPTDAIFLGFLNQYLIALRNDSEQFEYSDVGLPDVWLGEFYNAESRPDKAVSLHSAFGELMIPGTKTIENWADSIDPDSPFQRIPGATIERGSLSPYTVTQIDNSYYFLDSERRVIRLSGRSPQVISNPFDNEFQSLTRVDDAIGFHFNAEGSTKLVLTFPSAYKTYAYDYKLDYWAEWTYWVHGTGKRTNFIGRTGRFIPSWNKYLVGSASDGKIYIASRDYITDEGAEMIAEFQTARLDWGTPDRKSSNRIRFKVERGKNAPLNTNTPKIYYSTRDNGKTQWGKDKEIRLGAAGDTQSYITKRQLGTYRDRQYRFRMQGSPTTLAKATEIFEVIG